MFALNVGADLKFLAEISEEQINVHSRLAASLSAVDVFDTVLPPRGGDPLNNPNVSERRQTPLINTAERVARWAY